MKETRIDVTKQSAEELALANEQAQLIFKFNHTMPDTPEYDGLMHKIFPAMGEPAGMWSIVLISIGRSCDEEMLMQVKSEVRIKIQYFCSLQKYAIFAIYCKINP